MAHAVSAPVAPLAEWARLVCDYVESLVDEGHREADVDPTLLRALAETPPPAPTPQRPRSGRSLADIAADIAQCTKCDLHKTRTQTVPGQGSETPEIVFIGEGPGAEEDRQGIPFIGPAGNLLTRLIQAMGFQREDVFIANIVKCRPTVDGAGKRDRPPNPEEMAVCLPYLKAQIEALRPQVLVLLGNVALDGLFGFRGITRHRGRWLDYEGIPTMPTFHPSFLLRGGGEDKARYWDVWDDMCTVLQRMGRRPAVDKKRPARYGGEGP